MENYNVEKISCGTARTTIKYHHEMKLTAYAPDILFLTVHNNRFNIDNRRI